ncbi:MAG: hypothetical protein K2R98_00640 [Gemmataceae bacterium]|nr:hypothetical protein [Gemmataceae bacterium]
MEPRRRSDPGFGSGPPRYPGTFLLAFREAIGGLGWQAKRWLGNAVECVDAEGSQQVVGLENLFRRARRVERNEWKDLITEFLRQVNVTEQKDDLPTDLATVADQLLVRLGKPLQSLPDEARVWAQPLDGTDLVLTLVIDYPQRMIYVTEKLIADSGKEGAVWLDQALANLRARSEDDSLEVVHEESGMLLCNVGDAYDSSRAMILDTLLPEVGPEGYFVAIPSRDQLMVLPVRKDSLPFIHVMKLLVEKDFKTAPYPISDDVFWVRDGNWRLFGIDVQGQKVTLQPPEDFMEVLEEFLPDAEDLPESEDEV